MFCIPSSASPAISTATVTVMLILIGPMGPELTEQEIVEAMREQVKHGKKSVRK